MHLSKCSNQAVVGMRTATPSPLYARMKMPMNMAIVGRDVDPCRVRAARRRPAGGDRDPWSRPRTAAESSRAGRGPQWHPQGRPWAAGAGRDHSEDVQAHRQTWRREREGRGGDEGPAGCGLQLGRWTGPPQDAAGRSPVRQDAAGPHGCGAIGHSRHDAAMAWRVVSTHREASRLGVTQWYPHGREGTLKTNEPRMAHKHEDEDA